MNWSWTDHGRTCHYSRLIASIMRSYCGQLAPRLIMKLGRRSCIGGNLIHVPWATPSMLRFHTLYCVIFGTRNNDLMTTIGWKGELSADTFKSGLVCFVIDLSVIGILECCCSSPEFGSTFRLDASQLCGSNILGDKQKLFLPGDVFSFETFFLMINLISSFSYIDF